MRSLRLGSIKEFELGIHTLPILQEYALKCLSIMFTRFLAYTFTTYVIDCTPAIQK